MKSLPALLPAALLLTGTAAHLPPADRPAAVQATLARAYKGHRVKAAATIVQANGSPEYEAGMASSSQQRSALFTTSGQATK